MSGSPGKRGLSELIDRDEASVLLAQARRRGVLFGVFDVTPSSGRRHAPSSGLDARDKVACLEQASSKYRKVQHDEARDSHLRSKLNATFRQSSP